MQDRWASTSATRWACSRARAPARPTLQAAIATLGNDDPAVGYSVAYPFGVAGPILFLYVAFMVLKPKIEAPAAAGLEMLEIAVQQPGRLRQDDRRAR